MSSSKTSTEISDFVIEVYMWVSIGIVCQIINIFGIVTNILNIICFVRQGFDDSVNVSLLGLAVSDLGSLTAMVMSCLCITPAVLKADLPFEPLELAFLAPGMVHFAFTRVSGCITAIITVERCLCITIPLKIKSIVTPQRMAVVTVGVFIIFICSGAPVYFVNSFGLTFSARRNITLYGLVSTNNRESVEKISFSINNFIIPFATFVIIVVGTATLSLKLKSSTKWRQKTVTGTEVDKVTGRSQKAAKMVVMISALFIVCFTPVNIMMLAMGLLPSLSINGEHEKITLLIAAIGYIMESLNSSMNIFIYYHMSSKYKDIFRKLLYK